MKKPTLFALGAFAFLSGVSQAATIAFWDFNDHPDLTGQSNIVQVIHASSVGTGSVYQQKAEIELDGKTGVAYDNGSGLTAIAGKAMGWDDFAKSGSNDDGEFFITFSTFNFTNIVVSFDLKGNDDAGEGVNRFDLKYSLNTLLNTAVSGLSGGSGTIKTFDGNVDVLANQSVVTNGVTYTRVSYNLPAGVDGQTYVALRFDDWKEGNAMSIDNLLISGTAVPEPSAALLGCVALLGLARRRR